jgi:hypothetical protein
MVESMVAMVLADQLLQVGFHICKMKQCVALSASSLACFCLQDADKESDLLCLFCLPACLCPAALCPV